MFWKFKLMVLTYLGFLGGIQLISSSTTTTLVAAMSLANQDLERYFRQTNATHAYSTVNEERITMDRYTFAFLDYSYYSDDEGLQISSGFSEDKARYGEGYIYNRTGKLVHISDENNIKDDRGCSANILGTNGDRLPEKGEPWIALIQRGLCKFEDKVKHVATKGAIGVIVYNDKEVKLLEKMQIKNRSRNVTAVLTYQDVGLKLIGLLDKDYDVKITIREGLTGMRPINTLNRTSVLFVSVSFIVLMIVSLVWLIFYYIQRFRYLQAKDQQSRNLCSVTKKAIMKIPTKTGKSTDEKDADSDCCAICIEAYKASDVIRILPCKHEFHKNCIDPWLIEHRTCPMCKLDVLKFYGYVFLGSEESILEFDADRSANNTTQISAVTATAATIGVTADGIAANGTLHQQPTRNGALSDLIRSRDFVIDFPRVFVLEAGGTTGTHETLFPARLPERSQSSLSLAYAKDWMSAVTNKLDEQHGLKRIRKSSGQNNMQENLLTVRNSDSRKRRSHSADGRYSNGFFGRMEILAKQKPDDNERDDQAEGHSTPVASGGGSFDSRRNSEALRHLTDASYAKSKQRLREETNPRRLSLPRSSEASLRLIRRTTGPSARTTAPEDSDDVSSPNLDIKIQINGEGFEF